MSGNADADKERRGEVVSGPFSGIQSWTEMEGRGMRRNREVRRDGCFCQRRGQVVIQDHQNVKGMCGMRTVTQSAKVRELQQLVAMEGKEPSSNTGRAHSVSPLAPVLPTVHISERRKRHQNQNPYAPPFVSGAA